MEHQHRYGSGAIRGQQTFRYCSEPNCRHVLFYYGTNRPVELRDDDSAYYKAMAHYYGVDDD